jgi:hypothetical protein
VPCPLDDCHERLIGVGPQASPIVRTAETWAAQDAVLKTLHVLPPDEDACGLAARVAMKRRGCTHRDEAQPPVERRQVQRCHGSTARNTATGPHNRPPRQPAAPKLAGDGGQTPSIAASSGQRGRARSAGQHREITVTPEQPEPVFEPPPDTAPGSGGRIGGPAALVRRGPSRGRAGPGVSGSPAWPCVPLQLQTRLRPSDRRGCCRPRPLPIPEEAFLLWLVHGKSCTSLSCSSN